MPASNLRLTLAVKLSAPTRPIHLQPAPVIYWPVSAASLRNDSAIVIRAISWLKIGAGAAPVCDQSELEFVRLHHWRPH